MSEPASMAALLSFIADPAIVKICGCGARYTRAQWGALRYIGVLDDGVERLELRECSACGSTRAIAIAPKGANDFAAAVSP